MINNNAKVNIVCRTCGKKRVVNKKVVIDMNIEVMRCVICGGNLKVVEIPLIVTKGGK